MLSALHRNRCPRRTGFRTRRYSRSGTDSGNSPLAQNSSRRCLASAIVGHRRPAAPDALFCRSRMGALQGPIGMNRTFKAAVAALAVSFAGSVAAGPFEDAADAYEQGDYATALRLIRPIAEQGNAGAQTRLRLRRVGGARRPSRATPMLKPISGSWPPAQRCCGYFQKRTAEWGLVRAEIQKMLQSIHEWRSYNRCD
jgi:hypothetical protein